METHFLSSPPELFLSSTHPLFLPDYFGHAVCMGCVGALWDKPHECVRSTVAQPSVVIWTNKQTNKQEELGKIIEQSWRSMTILTQPDTTMQGVLFLLLLLFNLMMIIESSEGFCVRNCLREHCLCSDANWEAATRDQQSSASFPFFV